MTKTRRLSPKDRKSEILAVAVTEAERIGLANIRRDHIAEVAGVSAGLVSKYFNTMNQLRRAVVRAAINGEVLPVIAQALAVGDSEAKKAPEDLKKKALATLA